jgi:endonuclease V-like protein UPF0215 family
MASRPHVLGIDDGPFAKDQPERVPLVAVMMEGADLVEAVAVERFPVDGDGITEHLAQWIRGLRTFPALQAVFLGGVTIAGLAVVDVLALCAQIGLPVLVVTRRDPARSRVSEALAAAGYPDRLSVVDRTPKAVQLGEGLFVASAGATPERAAEIVRACVRKAQVPEALRVAHLVARAMVDGESKGRA